MTDKTNWYVLRKKYVFGDIRSVNAFLETQGIKINGFVTRRTKGWRGEKEKFEQELENATREKLIASLSDTEADVRKRQASIAKFMQEVALRVLDKYEPQSFAEALRTLQIGLKEEREALGLNNYQKPTNNIQPAFMFTRYAKRLQSMNIQEIVQELIKEHKDSVLN